MPGTRTRSEPASTGPTLLEPWNIRSDPAKHPPLTCCVERSPARNPHNEPAASLCTLVRPLICAFWFLVSSSRSLQSQNEAITYEVLMVGGRCAMASLKRATTRRTPAPAENLSLVAPSPLYLRGQSASIDATSPYDTSTQCDPACKTKKKRYQTNPSKSLTLLIARQKSMVKRPAISSWIVWGSDITSHAVRRPS